jgi:hypothetical protein
MRLPMNSEMWVDGRFLVNDSSPTKEGLVHGAIDPKACDGYLPGVSRHPTFVLSTGGSVCEFPTSD